MRDHEVHIHRVHPFAERIGDSLRQCLEMWQPGKDDFWALFEFEFFDRNAVGQRLQRVPCRRFEVYNRYLRIFFKLLKNDFRVILVAIL
ncbi:hypothetical protein D3C86_1900060 [compost metagenome]